jgi:hypothetical protein
MEIGCVLQSVFLNRGSRLVERVAVMQLLIQSQKNSVTQKNFPAFGKSLSLSLSCVMFSSNLS